jgi:hypothetical protein
MLRIPHFLNNLIIDGGEVVTFAHRSLFTPWYSFILLAVKPRATMQLEGLGKLGGGGRSWLRHYATSWKVMGSIPYEIIKK